MTHNAPQQLQVSATPPPGMEVVGTDWPCARCGYNLRTRKRSDPCPECGLMVAISLQASRLFPADHQRIRRVRTGLMMLAVSVGMTLGSMLLYLSFYLWEPPTQDPAWLWLFMAYVAAEHGMWVWGAWGVTASPTGGIRALRGRKLRLTVRIAAALNAAAMAAVMLPVMAVMGMNVNDSLFMVSLFATPATFVARFVAGLCLGGWLVRLARELDQPQSARVLDATLILFGLAMTLLLSFFVGVFTSGGDALTILLLIVLIMLAIVCAVGVIWLVWFERLLRKLATQEGFAADVATSGAITPDVRLIPPATGAADQTPAAG